ncbi:MAG: DUF4268 domain-containing protein [Prolixibacteraceae bacterium]|nr:DUF4268 domain-containing protein [Prolixibacteraceae bacterium]
MKIGRLEKLELRTLWKRESTEFTPWLAQEENLQLLSESIGIELELQSQEESVGPFRADILCKDTIDGHFVLIENQLEKTDHIHLGQLMTYGAGLDVVTIIWIAQKFTEEHRAALDWLNRITDSTYNFFGIEIEIYKIGDSLPAPKFNVVAKPNDWSKQMKKATSSPMLTEKKLLQQEYWGNLKEFMESKRSFVKMRNPLPQHWTDISIGKSSIYLSATINSKDNSINVWLNVVGEKSKETFDKLYNLAYKDSLTEISPNLIWDKMENRKQCAVILKSSGDFTKKSDWTNQFEWFKDNLEKYTTFFKSRIKSI